MKTTLARMRQLIGTTADWSANDLVIGDGELAIENQGSGLFGLRIGDGLKRFSELQPLLSTFVAIGPDAVERTMQDKAREWVSVLDYGADPTGVALCNAAFDKAKAACRTLLLPPNPAGGNGIYRLENYECHDVRFIGMRTNGANTGAIEQTVIEGSGDLLVNANNFSMESLLIRNSEAGVAGKLITLPNALDTRIGPFRDVEFRKATHHIFQGNTAHTIVDGLIDTCVFHDASVYSREYRGGLFKYAEHDCYTSRNKRGMLITNTSTALISGVFEYNDEMAVLVENTVTATNAICGLKFHNIHFEHNGNVTAQADLKIHVTQSLARVELDSVGFYLPTGPGSVDVAGNQDLRLFEHSCEGISYANAGAGVKFARVLPSVPGENNGLTTSECDIQAHGGYLIADKGFTAINAINTTIHSAPTPTPVSAPSSYSARMVLVRDITQSGAALLLMTDTAVTVAFTTISNVTWSIAGGFLNGQVTGGASSRVVFFNHMQT